MTSAPEAGRGRSFQARLAVDARADVDDGDDHDRPRSSTLLSPATLVHIKQVFGSRKRDPSPSAVVDGWQHLDNRGRRKASQPPPLAPPSQSTFLSPDHGISVEPATYNDDGQDYVRAKTVTGNGRQNVPEEYENDGYSSEDSHSGDEYAHIKAQSQRRRASSAGRAALATDETYATWIRNKLHLNRLDNLTALQRGVIKCALAYFISSLFTFLPFLSDLLASPFDLDGPVSGAHVVATVATYFNPAKTQGAMIEADIYMLYASGYALIVCIGSMLTAVWLNDLDQHVLSHFVVVIVWLIGSLGILAWMKVKVSNAQFGSACSMVALIVSSVVCKEGSIHDGVFQTEAITSIFRIVFLGTAISNAVCFLLWPGSATSKLQGDINKTLESFSTLIELLTSSFLNEEVHGKISDDSIRTAIEGHRTSFTALKASLSAARLELWDYRIQGTQAAYDQVVSSMNKLAQHLTGVRTAVTMERELDAHNSASIYAHGDRKSGAPRDHSIMDVFQEEVGPALRGLSATLKKALREIRSSFLQTRAGLVHHQASTLDGWPIDSDKLTELRSELEDRLVAYKSAHTKVTKKLYRAHPSQLASDQDWMDSPSKPRMESHPNEEVFIIYFFCFNLEEYAREQMALLDSIAAIQREELRIESDRAQYVKKFGRFAGLVQSLDVLDLYRLSRQDRPQTHRWKTLKKKVFDLMPFTSDKKPSPFPAVDDAAITSHAAAELRHRGRLGVLRRQIWLFFIKLKSADVRYALKTGIGGGLLGAFAFNHVTRPLFVQYSGNWAVLSFCVVMSTTIGATNFNSFFRIAGTVFGAAVATAAWYLLGNGHPVLMCGFAALFSLLPYAIILRYPKYATSGRFVLLSFNLTALYAYNVRHTGYDIEDIALHRTIAVTVGTLWGLFVTRFCFPFEARKELRAGLSSILLEMSHYYLQLAKQVQGHAIDDIEPLVPSSAPLINSVGETTRLLQVIDGTKLREERFSNMEMHLQISLISLAGLLDYSQHEPRLKGPFPAMSYAKILQACQRLLDDLHAMRIVALRPEFCGTVRSEFVLPTSKERRELVGNVLLYLSMLASALSLKSPLPPFLPAAEAARKRLIERVGHLPVIEHRAIRGTTPLLLFYSFSLMEQDCVAQLRSISDVFSHIFGVLGDPRGDGTGVDNFEQTFLPPTLENGLPRSYSTSSSFSGLSAAA